MKRSECAKIKLIVTHTMVNISVRASLHLAFPFFFNFPSSTHLTILPNWGTKVSLPHNSILNLDEAKMAIHMIQKV